MDRNETDPMEDLIAEGKIRQVSRTTGFIHESEIDFDQLYDNLVRNLQRIYAHWDPLITRYTGTRDEVIQEINGDVSSMVTFALWITYNRLRTVAERYSSHSRTQRMNHKAPCSNRMEFPAFLSSTLQSIGPLRILDSPHEIMLIYVPPANTANHYGRTQANNPIEGMYHRLLTHLHELNVQCSPIDLTPTQGSFATTCKFVLSEDLLSIVGSVHRSHYTNDDVRRFLLIANPNIDDTPFATITALTGIKPAVAAQGTTPAKPAGCYILGEKPIFTVYLAQNLTAYDINSVLRYHLTVTEPHSL
uniref:Putative CP n=1 Tax=Panax cryptic virus 4 TaxID=2809267 RepID=A0A890CAY8_9VIRU|nr:putative CP [Panax cryptic virus 4]